MYILLVKLNVLKHSLLIYSIGDRFLSSSLRKKRQLPGQDYWLKHTNWKFGNINAISLDTKPTLYILQSATWDLALCCSSEGFSMPFYAHHKHSITLWFHDRCRLMPMLNKGGPTFMSRLNVVTNIYYFFPPVKGGHWIWLLIVDNRMEIARLGMHQLGLFQASFPPLFFFFYSNMILLLSCGGWYQLHCPAFLEQVPLRSFAQIDLCSNPLGHGSELHPSGPL